MPLNNQDLRKHGLKVTGPRLKILSLLEKAEPHHMSAEDVYKALLASDEDIGLATVYRVLTQFEAAGLVQRHNFDGGYSIFELASDEHHDHIVCIDCGLVQEFHNDTIEQQQEEIAQKLGYQLQDHSLCLYGHCLKADCEYRSKPLEA